jgi:hypothetical protein
MPPPQKAEDSVPPPPGFIVWLIQCPPPGLIVWLIQRPTLLGMGQSTGNVEAAEIIGRYRGLPAVPSDINVFD